MILADSPVIEIAAGTVDDSEAQEVYRNLQVLYLFAIDGIMIH